MPYITVGEDGDDAVRLYYEDHGVGRPVVLVHGFPLDGQCWQRQRPALVDEGNRVISYDRRGFGRSSRPRAGYDYDTFAADLDALLDTLDLRDVVLAGFSTGTGDVARYLGARPAGRISKAVFVAPVPPFLLRTDDNPDGVDQSVFDEMVTALLGDPAGFLSSFLADVYNADLYLGNRVSEDVVRLSWAVATGASARATAEVVPSWLTDFRPDLPNVDLPTLIVHGTTDRILPIEATGEKLHKALPGSRFVPVEGGPHGLLWTHADEVNDALLGFLVC